MQDLAESSCEPDPPLSGMAPWALVLCPLLACLAWQPFVAQMCHGHDGIDSVVCNQYLAPGPEGCHTALRAADGAPLCSGRCVLPLS